MISYEPFYKTIKEKGISTYRLINEFGVSTQTLDDLCSYLDCRAEEILIYKKK